MSNKNRNNDFFTQSIGQNFRRVAGFQPEELTYAPPARDHGEEMPAFLRDQLNGKQKRDPWGKGWHGGFPPKTGAGF
jgi:hypothetical protein